MKLKTILACDRVIDEVGAGPTLVTTFQQITIAIPNRQPVPVDALLPKTWAIYTVWALEDQENNREYTQICEMLWPDGSQFFLAQLTSSAENANQFLTFTGKVSGFPIGQEGRLIIRVWMEEHGERVADPEETWLSVIHKHMEMKDTLNT